MSLDLSLIINNIPPISKDSTLSVSYKLWPWNVHPLTDTPCSPPCDVGIWTASSDGTMLTLVNNGAAGFSMVYIQPSVSVIAAVRMYGVTSGTSSAKRLKAVDIIGPGFAAPYGVDPVSGGRVRLIVLDSSKPSPLFMGVNANGAPKKIEIVPIAPASIIDDFIQALFGPPPAASTSADTSSGTDTSSASTDTSSTSTSSTS